MKLYVLIFLTISGFIFAQDKTSAPAEKKIEPKETHESKPMKHESGDVQIDPADISEGLRKSNHRNLSKIRVSLLNQGGAEKFNKLMGNFVGAVTVFQTRKFLDARKKFQENALEIKEECKSVTEKYKSVYSKLAQETPKIAVEKKMAPDEGSSTNLASVLESHMNSALQTGATAEELLTSNPCDSISFYRNSIFHFLMIYYAINKDKNRYMTTKERLGKNLLIDDDYIPQEYMKDYDDSLELVSVNREKIREKDREDVRKMISVKYGEKKPAETQEKNPMPEKTADKQPEKKPEPKTDEKSEKEPTKPTDKK